MEWLSLVFSPESGLEKTFSSFVSVEPHGITSITFRSAPESASNNELKIQRSSLKIKEIKKVALIFNGAQLYSRQTLVRAGRCYATWPVCVQGVKAKGQLHSVLFHLFFNESLKTNVTYVKTLTLMTACQEKSTVGKQLTTSWFDWFLQSSSF